MGWEPLAKAQIQSGGGAIIWLLGSSYIFMRSQIVSISLMCVMKKELNIVVFESLIKFGLHDLCIWKPLISLKSFHRRLWGSNYYGRRKNSYENNCWYVIAFVYVIQQDFEFTSHIWK